ncbi:hypothetical protein EON77_03370 [bacterium]|nr:MAG: hypothetical protein EON77_03370 [bacterium]
MLTALAFASALQTMNPPQTSPPQAAPPQTVPAQTPADPTVVVNPVRNVRSIEAAYQVLQRIRKEAYSPSSHFYGEEWELGKRPAAIAFNWSVGVLFSALASAAKTDPKLKEPLIEMANATTSYWNDEGPVAGYDVLPGPKPKDRYYDDNEWLVLALMEAYDVTKKVDYLVRARDTFAYVLSGETKELGGGILWRENEKTTKNACSNAPAAYAALGLYDRTKDKRYLADAVRIYRWTDERLRDPADGLMWDSVSVDGTKIEKTKWS